MTGTKLLGQAALTLLLCLGNAPAGDAASPGRESCVEGTICVGPDRPLKSLSAAIALAQPGDIIEIEGGTYHESVAIPTPNLLIRGVGGRPHIDCAGLRPAADKACLLLAADGITLENLEISGAAISEEKGADAACIRNEPGRDFTLRNIVCHASQNGILTDGGSPIIEGSEFYDNGWSGLTHNVYFSGDCPLVIIRASIFRDAVVGHEFKSRCRETSIADSIFHARKGSRALDFPDGGIVTIDGGMLIQEIGVHNKDMIGFTAESCREPASFIMHGTRIVGRDPAGTIANYGRCPVTMQLIDINFEGMKPWLRGAVRVGTQ